MNKQEAKTIISSMKTQNKSFAEVGINVIEMLSNDYETQLANERQRTQMAIDEKKAVQRSLDAAIDHASAVDCTCEYAELQAAHDQLKREYEALKQKLSAVNKEAEKIETLRTENEALKEHLEKLKKTEAKRRGRPPKRVKEESSAVHALAAELASMN